MLLIIYDSWTKFQKAIIFIIINTIIIFNIYGSPSQDSSAFCLQVSSRLSLTADESKLSRKFNLNFVHTSSPTQVEVTSLLLWHRIRMKIIQKDRMTILGK